MKKTILVDMDGVLADFERGFQQKWKTQYPERRVIPLEERTTFHIEDQYPKEIQEDAKKITQSQNFFLELEPIKGGIEALSELALADNTIFICTSPISVYQHCVPEKYAWIDKHLGKDWVKKLIVTKDKTMVKGDILIYDRPTITGAKNPEWEHILYDQPYNKTQTGKRRITWQNYQSILECEKNIEYQLFYEKKSIYHHRGELHQHKIPAPNDNEALQSATVYIDKIESRSASKYINQAYLMTPNGKKTILQKGEQK